MNKKVVRSQKINVKETVQLQLDDTSFVDYYSGFLSNEMADSLLDELLTSIPWREVTHREKKIPRLQCWMSDPNVQAQLFQKEPALEWSKEILILKRMIEEELRSRNINVVFDYVLMNYYRDGNDKIGFHSDDEAYEEGKNIIGSISLGASRIFEMVKRTKKKSNNRYDFVSNHGSLIVMRGDTQLNWLHSIQGDPSVTTPRINLTFRKS